MAPTVGKDAQGRTTYTFSYTGAVEPWTVPSGVTRIKIEAFGAQGNSLGTAGGRGAKVTATISVTPGEVLYMYVGGINGWNGGGAGGYSKSGFNGGGATDIRRGGTGLNNRIIVAGGGGGAAYDYHNLSVSRGGAGGQVGSDGEGGSWSTSRGRGATQSSGGSGGIGYDGGGDGGSGALGIGGSGGYGYSGGGGGGGGYYGGGGGGGHDDPSRRGGGGGGGSSYVIPSATDVTYESGVRVGDGLIVITILNTPPTIILDSPQNYLTLSEGSVLPIEGSATESDNGNVVTVKYQINDGPIRAIASWVSDGSTPLSFARTLTYHDKRLWDGGTDVVGVDLAENVDHILKVWAEDDQGGKSVEVTRIFRVIWNRPPTISGADEDLGTIMEPPSKTYSVTDPEGNPFTITEKIDGKVIRTFPGVAGREETITIPHDMWIRLDLDTPHELTVEATDSKGLTSTRTFTFIRTETHIEFMLNFDNPDVEAHFTLDGMPKRVLVTLERHLPPGSQIEFVRVCNNAMDEVPTWEDATAAVLAGRGYLFTNQQKTAENWRINIWVRIAKGTATERVLLNGYGGAFD